MAYLVRLVDEPSDAPRRENIQKRNALADALGVAQGLVRERLRAGYHHADFVDQWTILKRADSVCRVRIEDATYHRPQTSAADPVLWTPHHTAPSRAAVAAGGSNGSTRK